MGNTAKAIGAYIYKHPCFLKCPNGGFSERFVEVLVLCDSGPIDVDMDNPPENLVRIERVSHTGFLDSYVKAVPVADAPKGTTGWMNGGAIVDSSDARFRRMTGGCPAYLHDRTETWEQYDALSR